MSETKLLIGFGRSAFLILMLTRFLTKSMFSHFDLEKRHDFTLLQACEELQFGPVCICLAVNYLDRFLSVHDLPVSFLS